MNKNHRLIIYPNLWAYAWTRSWSPPSDQTNPLTSLSCFQFFLLTFLFKIGPQKEYMPKWYQSSGMDQRVEQLETAVQSLSSGQQAIANQMNEVLSQMNSKFDEIVRLTRREGEASTSKATHESPSSNSTPTSFILKMKLDFPRFNKWEDPTSWICRAEQFFQFHNTLTAKQVFVVSFFWRMKRNFGSSCLNKNTQWYHRKISKRAFIFDMVQISTSTSSAN